MSNKSTLVAKLQSLFDLTLLFLVATCICGCRSGVNLASTSGAGDGERSVTLPVRVLQRIESHARTLLIKANSPSETDIIFIIAKPRFELADYNLSIRKVEYASEDMWLFSYEYSAPLPILGFPQIFRLWVNTQGHVSATGPGGPWLEEVPERQQ